MNIYITLHRSTFLSQQRAAIAALMPEAKVWLVATRNASKEIKQAAHIATPHIQTAAIVPFLLPRVAPGPGCVLEWDMVPVQPIPQTNAINVEPSAYGRYPSAMAWSDPSELRQGYVVDGSSPFTDDVITEWHHEVPAVECAEHNHFVLIGGCVLHYHNWAGGKRPVGVVPQRSECWDRVLSYYLDRSAMSQQKPKMPAALDGPGAQLKAVLRDWLGITATPTCSCNARARTMDANGCDWCEEHLDEIVGWLREEAGKRKLPFLDAAGRVLVRRAIRNARKEQARAQAAKEGSDQGSGSAV